MNSSGRPRVMAGKRVLIVEDTIENLRLFRAILKLEQAEVLEASRASEGIEIARQELPDVILMDLQMPEIDGITATRLLRADPVTQHIPIVVITASLMPDDRIEAINAGCNGYITKPVEPATFGQQIIEFMATAPITTTPTVSP